MEGLNRLLEQKQFTDSNVIRQTRAQYENESDSVRLFLDEQSYIASFDGYVAIKDLYQEYQRFCQDDGYRAVSKLNFRKRLEHAKIVIGRKNIGNVAFVYKDHGYKQAKS